MRYLRIVAAGAASLFASNAFAEDPAKPVDPRLGEAVSSICFAGNINGFRTLKGEDDVVILERGVRDFYRVGLTGMCTASVLASAQAVAIQSRPAGGCLTRGDTLEFSTSAFFSDRSIERTRCVVTSIHKWNPDVAKAK
ncbi:MAG: hypothetical protein K2Q06_15540 [Parvularculaceae bacterium]|nr:hypothetical protein [Parvularculaceae bacterium]